MIDIIKCKKLFDEYLINYDMNNADIKRKYKHSLRVSDLCKQIAVSLNLDIEEQKIAQLMGLLHDIGRFNQAKKFNTYDDRKSFNHGLEGYNILKENDYINQYIDDEEIKQIVLKGVINHNKTFIDSNLTEKEKKFINILRDADKIDIYSIFVNEMIVKSVDENISQNLYDRLLLCKIDYEDRQNDLDHYLLAIGLIYDVNYKISYQIIKKEDYLNKIIDKVQIKNRHEKLRLEKLRTIVNNYLGGKLC